MDVLGRDWIYIHVFDEQFRVFCVVDDLMENICPKVESPQIGIISCVFDIQNSIHFDSY